MKRGPPAEADVIDVGGELSAEPRWGRARSSRSTESAAPEAPPALDDAAEEAPARPPKKPRGRPRKHPLPGAPAGGAPPGGGAEWEDAAPEEAFSVCAEASSVRAPDDEAQWDEPAAPPASGVFGLRRRRRCAPAAAQWDEPAAPPAPDDEARWDEPAAPPAPDDEAQWDEPAAPPAPGGDGRSAFGGDTVNGEVEPRTPPAFDPRKLVVVDERGGRRCDLEDFEEGAGFLVPAPRRVAVLRGLDDSTIERDVKWPRVTWDDGADAAAHAPGLADAARLAGAGAVVVVSPSPRRAATTGVGDAESESDSDSSDDDAEEGQAERDGSEEEPSPPDDAPADAVSPLHVDALNCGPSCIVAFGDFEGGELWVHGRGAIDVKTPQTFDGNRAAAALPWRTPVAGERYSAIFFLHACHDRLARATASASRTSGSGCRRGGALCTGRGASRRGRGVAADPALRGRVLLADDADDDDDDFVEARPSGRDRRTSTAPRARRRVGALSDDPDDEGRAPEPAAPPSDEDEFAFDVDDDDEVDVDDEDAAVGEEEDTDRGGGSDDDAPLVVLREGDARVALDSGRAWLKPHQRSCLKFVAQNVLVSLRGSAAAAPAAASSRAMGLGKTFVVVALCCLLLNDDTLRAAAAAGGRRLDRVLVVAPASTLDNWAREIDLWSRRLLNNDGVADRVFHLFRLAKSVDERRRVAKEWSARGGVLLLSYELFGTLVVGGQKRHRGFFTTYVAEAADVVVCDEAHRVKREKARLATALAAVFNHPHVAALARRHNEARAPGEAREAGHGVVHLRRGESGGLERGRGRGPAGPAAAPRAPREAADVLCAASRAWHDRLGGDLAPVVGDARPEAGAKALVARDILVKARARGEKVLVFSQSLRSLDYLQISVRAAGQERPVFVYRLVAGTVEERVFNRQIAKGAVASGVADDEVLQRFFRRDELADLIPLAEIDVVLQKVIDGRRDCVPVARTPVPAPPSQRKRPRDAEEADDKDTPAVEVTAAAAPAAPGRPSRPAPSAAEPGPAGAATPRSRTGARPRPRGRAAAVAAQAPRDAEESDEDAPVENRVL
ncbi:hypothetical protein JL720_13726 [Aureococcus anophagefferens]|nr:hypothetical protein JL720_13726 [Aureococcus anophagefferens]